MGATIIFIVYFLFGVALSQGIISARRKIYPKEERTYHSLKHYGHSFHDIRKYDYIYADGEYRELKWEQSEHEQRHLYVMNDLMYFLIHEPDCLYYKRPVAMNEVFPPIVGIDGVAKLCSCGKEKYLKEVIHDHKSFLLTNLYFLRSLELITNENLELFSSKYPQQLWWTPKFYYINPIKECYWVYVVPDKN